MKRLVIFCLALALLCPLTACTAKAPQQAQGKTLVVYYSATGTTKAAAQHIADATGAALFELTPEQPYEESDLNWQDPDSRVSREMQDAELLASLRLTQSTVPDWQSYDTVYIGYPLWGAVAAWPASAFVRENDFSGKKVIPFCTSAASDIGESAKNLSQQANGGDWQAGKRFSADDGKDAITSWVQSLQQ